MYMSQAEHRLRDSFHKDGGSGSKGTMETGATVMVSVV